MKTSKVEITVHHINNDTFESDVERILEQIETLGFEAEAGVGGTGRGILK